MWIYEPSIQDHKDTATVSLFKLSFVWSGLGLEGPLVLRLQRYPERFSIRFARLVEQVEQRDFQNEGKFPEPHISDKRSYLNRGRGTARGSPRGTRI